MSTADLGELQRAGLEILFVEAIATGPRPRVTVGSPYSAALERDLAELVALQDATLDGVTSPQADIVMDDLYWALTGWE